MEVLVWYRAHDDSIHITSDDDHHFDSTIKNDGDSVRAHRSLFKHFKRALMDQGRWPKSAD
jgi:hypothetical protein